MAPYRRTTAFLVGVSGGRDSVALLTGLLELGFTRLTVVHLDHRLRGRASAGDATFVRKLAAGLAVPIVAARSETSAYAADRGISIELAARELRLAAFAAAAKKKRCPRILLAHHAEDQIETCLFNFLRGSGASGLAGMRAETRYAMGKIELMLIRPMLGIRRTEVDAFVADRRLKFREDASNQSEAHTRNRVRGRVLPVITEAFGGSFGDAILRAGRIFEAEDAYLREVAEQIETGEALRLAELRALPLAIRRRVVRRWLDESGVSEAGLAEVERVLSLLEVGDGPAKVNLPGGLHARRRQGVLFLERT